MGPVASRWKTVTTDASVSRWGAVWQNWTTWGNVACRGPLEAYQCAGARAVHMALQFFLPFLRGRHMLVRSDTRLSHKPPRGNQVRTAVAGVSGPPVVGGPPPMYLPGEQNRDADFLSRCKSPLGEWRLHPEVVLKIWNVFGRAEVDLFATEESTHCPLWLS